MMTSSRKGLNMIESKEVRILVIDNDSVIHKNFNEIFNNHANSFSTYLIQSVYEFQAGLNAIKNAKDSNKPFSIAFIDTCKSHIIESMMNIWNTDPDIQLVICSKSFEYNWAEMSQKLKNSDDFLMLTKP